MKRTRLRRNSDETAIAFADLRVVVNCPEELKQRFQAPRREAEVLAALNHPNIAHIFGVEKAGGTFALAMELVEGVNAPSGRKPDH